MRTVTKKVFLFNELSEQAKQVARDWYKSIMDKDFAHEVEMITESMDYTLKEEGFVIEKNGIQWDLSYSQGDYVGIDGKIEEKKFHQLIMDGLSNKEKKWYKMLAIDDNYIEVVNDFNYHSYYRQLLDVEVQLHLDEQDYPFITSFYEKVKDIAYDTLEHEVNRIREKLMKQGYEDIRYFYSDECVDEILIGNDYEFEESGKKYIE